MPRYSVPGRSTVTPTAARSGVSLFNVASRRAKLREVYVFNTTTTAFVIALVRHSNATGVGSGLTEVKFDIYSPDAECAAFAGHTADGGVGDEIVRAPIGAAIGAGAVWTFDSEPVMADAGTANGLGLLCPTGTGQIFDYTLIWEE